MDFSENKKKNGRFKSYKFKLCIRIDWECPFKLKKKEKTMQNFILLDRLVLSFLCFAIFKSIFSYLH